MGGAAIVGPVTDTRPDEDVRAAIRNEQRLLDPAVRRSARDLEALLHPDFTEVDAAGRRWARPDVIAELTSPVHGTPAGQTASELTGVRLSGSTVLVTYVSDQGAQRARRSSLWLRTGPGWRLYFHQATAIQPS